MNIDVKTSSNLSFYDNELNYISEKVLNNTPFLIITLLIGLLFYFIIIGIPNFNNTGKPSLKTLNSISLTGSVTKPTNSLFLNILEIFLWSMLLFLVMINGLQYFFNIDIQSSIKNLFTHDPSLKVKVKTANEMKNLDNSVIDNIKKRNNNNNNYRKEVFHIPNNNYTYQEAKSLCKAYNADLATYDQIAKAHKKGAEWCSYGWSEDQMAYYPTQTATYESLKKKKGHENDCGRPGINGGYISNVNAKFGVNCYGKKPSATSNDMETLSYISDLYKTKEEKNIERKANEYRTKIENIGLAPFNKSKWSII